MGKRSKIHVPSDVLKRAGDFSDALARYRALVSCVNRTSRSGAPVFNPEAVATARRLWSKLSRLGKQLLQAGNDWGMSEWIAKRPEWLPLERSGFFEGDAFEDEEITEYWCDWGLDLGRFLAEPQQRGRPLGFRTHPREEWRDILDNMFGDVARDVRALIAATHERLEADRAGSAPLNDRQKEVLKLIPFGPDRGILGKEIIAMLGKAGDSLGLSTLTRHVIPRLKQFHNVRNQRGVGYYRIA